MMKPYYETELGKLYHGDCLEIMPQLGPVDLVLADPPYGTTACPWDSIIPLDAMWKAIGTIQKERTAIIMTSAQPFTSVLVSSNLPLFKYDWIWEKSQATGHLNAYKMPMRKHEVVCVFYEKLPYYNPQLEGKLKENIRPETKIRPTTSCYGVHDKKSCRKIPNDKTLPTSIIKFNNSQGWLHPTQKPVALFAYLTETYSKPDDLIIDFCLGSGTTALVCERLSRRWIGIEKSEQYCEIAAKRIEKETRQLKLF